MENKICEICGTEFKGRENQKYCSDACKQKAYKERKDIIQPKEPIQSFKMSEFKQLNDYFNDFLAFCFVRKNYKINFNPDEFKEYCNNLGENFWENLWKNGTPENEEFKKFKRLFHSGLMEVVK